MDKAIKVIVLLGFVSLFADITYEGARGIIGPFLFTLGASATVAGLASGLGEFVGYGLRLVSGYVADKTKWYWPIAILGYLINLIAVPALALAGNWEIAIALIIAERLGKAIRTPARDTILSLSSSKIGYGKAFGLHEALDQIGAIIGPLIASGVIYTTKSYNKAFLLLGIPAVLSLITLFATVVIYPKPENLKAERKRSNNQFNKILYVFVMFSILTVCGYPPFQIISFHLKKGQIISDAVIPVLFAIAMGIDALTALIIGSLFDKFKLKLILLIPLFSIPIPILAFLGNNLIAVAFSAVLWGIVMGFHETIMKSAVATISTSENRGSAFGIFHSSYGFAWLVGSITLGKLYEVSIFYLIAFSMFSQFLSIACFIYLKKLAKDEP